MKTGQRTTALTAAFSTNLISFPKRSSFWRSLASNFFYPHQENGQSDTAKGKMSARVQELLAPEDLNILKMRSIAFMNGGWPNGFTNTFHEFDLRPGGALRFTMHAPDGAAYENFCQFVEIKPSEHIVIDHIEPVHSFRLTADITITRIGTELRFNMTFALREEYERIKNFVRAANEQNFDRLEAVLQKIKLTH